jgi:hypothetical protein
MADGKKCFGLPASLLQNRPVGDLELRSVLEQQGARLVTVDVADYSSILFFF